MARYLNSYENLTIIELCLEYAYDEFFDAQSARTSDVLDYGSRPKGREGRDPVRGRIGMHDTASDSAAITHRAVSYASRYRWQRTVGDIGNALILDIRMCDATADEQRVFACFDSLEVVDRCDVDQKVGLHETEIEHWPERLAAGDEFRRTIVCGKPER